MKTIVNCETGEVIERELNQDELNQQKADEAAQAKIETLAAEAKAKAEADKAAILARLGLTEDELKTILG